MDRSSVVVVVGDCRSVESIDCENRTAEVKYTEAMQDYWTALTHFG